ncbi:MAG: hypothetical protein P8Z73_08300 [Desulfobacteraceae bacterium]|jgi:hypothetical protein
MDKRLYKIEKLAHCVRVVFENGMVVGPDEIIAAIDHENEIYAIEGRHDLWDFRGCRITPGFGFDGMNRVVDRIKGKYGRANENNKTALLVDDGSTPYGLSRMFQLLMDGYPTQIGIFKDEAAATQWISKPVNPEE